MEFLDDLAKVTGHDPEPAKMIVSDRISELEEPDHSEHRANFTSHSSEDREKFSDDALMSLFVNLTQG